VLHGIKVLDITRIIAGPIASLQLSQLGADVMRVSSADIFDYVGSFCAVLATGSLIFIFRIGSPRTISELTSANAVSRWTSSLLLVAQG
jgi:hypothetical protein